MKKLLLLVILLLPFAQVHAQGIEKQRPVVESSESIFKNKIREIQRAHDVQLSNLTRFGYQGQGFYPLCGCDNKRNPNCKSVDDVFYSEWDQTEPVINEAKMNMISVDEIESSRGGVSYAKTLKIEHTSGFDPKSIVQLLMINKKNANDKFNRYQHADAREVTKDGLLILPTAKYPDKSKIKVGLFDMTLGELGVSDDPNYVSGFEKTHDIYILGSSMIDLNNPRYELDCWHKYGGIQTAKQNSENNMVILDIFKSKTDESTDQLIASNGQLFYACGTNSTGKYGCKWLPAHRLTTDMTLYQGPEENYPIVNVEKESAGVGRFLKKVLTNKYSYYIGPSETRVLVVNE